MPEMPSIAASVMGCPWFDQSPSFCLKRLDAVADDSPGSLGGRTTVLASGGTTLQPSDDFVGSRLTGRDLLHHRNVRIRIFPRERSAVGFKEQPHGEESGSLVAVGQRVVAGQMLDQDRCFLYERGIRVLIAEACLRCGKGRVCKRNPRQARDPLGSRTEQFSGDLAVIAKLQIDRQGLLGEAAQGLAISLDRSLDPPLALGAASGQAKAQLVSLGLGGGGSLRFHRRHIVTPCDPDNVNSGLRPQPGNSRSEAPTGIEPV